MKNKDRPEVQKACVEFFAHQSKSIVELLIPLGLGDTHEYISIPDWLNSEYVPFTEFELELMKHIDQKYHWIGRCEDGEFIVHKEKPIKESDLWHSKKGDTWACIGGLIDGIFQSIKWSDEEPVCIDDYVDRKEE